MLKTVTSPCVRNCCLNEDDICLGCFRSLDEICRWGGATLQEKQEILGSANTRRTDLKMNL